MIADAIKIKVLSVVGIAAVTALCISAYVIKGQSDNIDGLTRELTTLVVLKDLQGETIQSLQEELETKPKEYIKIVKEVDRKLCEGIITADSILKLPPTPKQDGELLYETKAVKGTVDIDGKLPADLIRLLQ